jgi:hypothetical protein
VVVVKRVLIFIKAYVVFIMLFSSASSPHSLPLPCHKGEWVRLSSLFYLPTVSLQFLTNVLSLLAFSGTLMKQLVLGHAIKVKTKGGGALGSVVVKALYYKPEGCGFETRRGEKNFSIYLILPAALGPGVYFGL